MARVRDVLSLAVMATLVMAGCGVAQSREADDEAAIEMEEAAATETDAVRTVEVGPEAVEQGVWFDSWEEAAVAEAERLHPDLSDLTAERVSLTTEGERVVVRGESGFCALYGGLAVEDRWQANEIMVLDDYCGASG